MSLPNSYLTSTKNLSAIFDAIRTAQAPEKFTTRFLESLGFKSNSDRLIISVLKALGFLTSDSAKPTDRYYRFLDQTQSEIVLAEAIRESYSDLFQIKVTAHTMSNTEIVNKLKTLTQGQYSEAVLKKMASTFTALCKNADFSTKKSSTQEQIDQPEITSETAESVTPNPTTSLNSLGGLHYNIQIILPESRDPKVYDVLFRSLREHLIQ